MSERKLTAKYASLEKLEERIKKEGVKPEDHTLYNDLLEWRAIKHELEASGIFKEVLIIGAKIRAIISETLFLEIYYDPTTKSYSYGLVDMTLPYIGDKRIFGWDDYPHEGMKEIKRLKSYPHHFQRREKETYQSI
ncbi:MAG: hypothetical protein HY930_05970 [Euryarchaeota archaeon]|nr:hypothetical protein [Euryarchaeota archaeon]